MSPINQDTIRAERWTKPSGVVKQQVVAEGDTEDPGVWIFSRGIRLQNINHVRGNRIVDVYVNQNGEIEEKVEEFGIIKGLWERVKGSERR